MEYPLDEMMPISELKLNYEVHIAGIDGECFYYSVYFDTDTTDRHVSDIREAIDNYFALYTVEDIYLGYTDVYDMNGTLTIYLDLGGVESENESLAIEGVLKALNNVSGIIKVIIDENDGFDI